MNLALVRALLGTAPPPPRQPVYNPSIVPRRLNPEVWGESVGRALKHRADTRSLGVWDLVPDDTRVQVKLVNDMPYTVWHSRSLPANDADLFTPFDVHRLEGLPTTLGDIIDSAREFHGETKIPLDLSLTPGGVHAYRTDGSQQHFNAFGNFTDHVYERLKRGQESPIRLSPKPSRAEVDFGEVPLLRMGNPTEDSGLLLRLKRAIGQEIIPPTRARHDALGNLMSFHERSISPRDAALFRALMGLSVVGMVGDDE